MRNHRSYLLEGSVVSYPDVGLKFNNIHYTVNLYKDRTYGELRAKQFLISKDVEFVPYQFEGRSQNLFFLHFR